MKIVRFGKFGDNNVNSNLLDLSKNNQKDINDFLDYCKITACASSLIKIKAKITIVAKTIKKDLRSLDLETTREFLGALNHSDLAISTKNDIKKTLKRFIRWKFKNWNRDFEELKDLRLTNTKFESRKLTKKDLLTSEEMNFLVKSIDSLKYKTLLILLGETACRPEEVLKLKWKDIDFNTRELKLSSSKTGMDRTIPLNEGIEHLKRYETEGFTELPLQDSYIFPNIKSKSGHLSVVGLNEFLDRLQRTTHFKKNLYPYLWRHSVLSQRIKKLSGKTYEMFAGHSLEMGMRTYAHLDTEDLRQELNERVYDIVELKPNERAELSKLKEDVEKQNKKFEFLLQLWENSEDAINEIAEGGKIIIAKQTKEESAKIIKEIKEKIMNY